QRACGHAALEPAQARRASEVIHPALLDNALQVVAAALWARLTDTAHVPVGIDVLRIAPLAGANGLSCAVAVTGDHGAVVRADLHLYADDGAYVGELRGLQLAAVDLRKLPAER